MHTLKGTVLWSVPGCTAGHDAWHALEGVMSVENDLQEAMYLEFNCWFRHLPSCFSVLCNYAWVLNYMLQSVSACHHLTLWTYFLLNRSQFIGHVGGL